jgi:hypothetical protein
LSPPPQRLTPLSAPGTPSAGAPPCPNGGREGGCHTPPNSCCLPIPLGSRRLSRPSRLPHHCWLWLLSRPSGSPSSRALMPASWSLGFFPSSQRAWHLPGISPFVVQLFRVDLLDFLDFGSHPNIRVACFHGWRRPSLGLCLLGRPLGSLAHRRGQLHFVVQPIVRTLLPPVILALLCLALFSGHHHLSEFDTGTGVHLQCASTFVTARHPLCVAAHLVPTHAQICQSHPLHG